MRIILYQFVVFLLLAGLCFHCWRGLIVNGAYILNSVVQLNDLGESYVALQRENHEMFSQIKFANRQDSKELIRIQEELQVLSDPEKQILVKYGR